MEIGRNGGDHPKLLSLSLQSFLWPIQDAWDGMWNKTRTHLVHYTLGRKCLVLSITRKKKLLNYSLVQICRCYRHKGRPHLLVFPLILKERINQGNLRSCTDLFLKRPQTVNVSLLSWPKKCIFSLSGMSAMDLKAYFSTQLKKSFAV